MVTTAPESEAEDVMAMVSLRVPIDLFVWLDTSARGEERSRSSLIRELLTTGRHAPEAN